MDDLMCHPYDQNMYTNCFVVMGLNPITESYSCRKIQPIICLHDRHGETMFKCVRMSACMIICDIIHLHYIIVGLHDGRYCGECDHIEINL